MYGSVRAPTFHFVLLKAITVAGRRINVLASVFAAGAIIDSGTVITRLPPTAYRALRTAFRAEMKMYPPARSQSILDTCFNLTGVGHVKLPRVALVFDRGAAMELHPAGILQYECLAFASSSDDKAIGIIGNVQQRTFEVLYDVRGGAVGFRRSAC
uniref:Peptidase A1 domain-containing protein n=1 Tax=Arundo donax TaxID=35708 RepID=A0A0A9HQI6_ARUDO